MLTPSRRWWNLVLVPSTWKKKTRREWCISSSRKWPAKNPAFSNLTRICFSFWVGCQPGNTTPWRRRCPKECPQEGLIDRCSMRPSDLGIAQHLRCTLTSWNTCTICTTHTHIHNSIISIHAYISSYEMMDTWWHVVSACSLQNCQVAHGLIAQIEKEETHASGKIEKKQPISLDSCHQMSSVCPVGMVNRWYSDRFASICTKKHCNTGGVTFFGKHMLKQKDMKSESTWK